MIPISDTAPKAAGIHSDFEKSASAPEAVSFNDLVSAGSMAAAKSRAWSGIEARTRMVDG